MTRMLPEFVDSDPADRMMAVDARVREEPEEEDDEEDDDDKEDPDDEEDDDNRDGYSE